MYIQTYRYVYVYMYMYVFMCIYIYIYACVCMYVGSHVAAGGDRTARPLPLDLDVGGLSSEPAALRTSNRHTAESRPP